jgi:hypothetical protein
MVMLHKHDGVPGKARNQARRNKPKFDLRLRLYQMCGVDLTRIDGIDVGTAMTVLAEVGVDMSKFPTVIPVLMSAEPGSCPQWVPRGLPAFTAAHCDVRKVAMSHAPRSLPARWCSRHVTYPSKPPSNRFGYF